MSFKFGSVRASRLKKNDGSTALVDASDVFQGTLTAASVTAHEAALEAALDLDDIGTAFTAALTVGAPTAGGHAINKTYADANYAGASAVSTNASDISTNASGIATNSAAITSNTTDISTNTASLSTNSASIGTNAGNISTNTTNIATNATAISNLSGGLSWLASVDSFLDDPSAAATDGTRYVVGAVTGDWASATVGDIAAYSGGAWGFSSPSDGNAVVLEDDGDNSSYPKGIYFYDAETSSWLALAKTSALSGKASAGVNNDITELTGLTTALSIAQGGTGATTAAAARTALGVDASGTDNSTPVTISTSGNAGYASITGQELSFAAIDLSSHTQVTGTLPGYSIDLTSLSSGALYPSALSASGATAGQVLMASSYGSVDWGNAPGTGAMFVDDNNIQDKTNAQPYIEMSGLPYQIGGYVHVDLSSFASGGNNTAAVEIRLPSSADMATAGAYTRWYDFKFAGLPTGSFPTITVKANGSDLIDGAASFSVDEEYGAVTITFAYNSSTFLGWRLS